MNAKVAFAVSGVLAAIGILLMLMSFLGKGELEKLQDRWPNQVKKIEKSLEDEEFPSSAFIQSEQDHGKALGTENDRIWERLQQFHETLNESFASAPRGAEDPQKFNIAFNTELEELQKRHSKLIEELDWGSRKAPFGRLQRVPQKSEIPVLQAKFWIVEALLAALAHHAPEGTLEYNQRAIVLELTVEKNPDGPRKEDAAYDLYRVKLNGLIPFPTVAAALSDLTTNQLDSSETPHSGRSLLFVPVSMDVTRSEPDPDKVIEEQFYIGDPIPDRTTPPALQNQIELVLEVRDPRPYPKPVEE